MNEQVTTSDDLKSLDSQQRAAEQPKRPSGPEPMCPMASMCSGFVEKSPNRFLLMLPGAVLILIGVAILLQPQVLVWLVAAGAFLVGCAMLVMANLVHRLCAKAASTV